MGSETPRTVRDPQAKPTCLACGRPVGIVAKRHKVLGAWVPEWEVQPCRNPACARYIDPAPVDDEGEGEGDGPAGTSDTPGGAGAAVSAPAGGPDVPPDSGAETATPQVTGKNGEIGRSPATG
ncbi:hypothetical protein ACIPPS_02350 [Streptomyces sp. NPDC090127]|uniref:hypothetical protein n=1 Tax=Streptomyces sp. NPDC090127 TaxID=3365953 RepID=UPI00382F0368